MKIRRRRKVDGDGREREREKRRGKRVEYLVMKWAGIEVKKESKEQKTMKKAKKIGMVNILIRKKESK